MAIDKQAKTFREGRWSEDEHEKFECGVKRFGWGNWAMMATMIPSRSTKQIKSHAQKVAKQNPARKEMLVEEHAILRQQRKKYTQKTKKQSARKSARTTKARAPKNIRIKISLKEGAPVDVAEAMQALMTMRTSRAPSTASHQANVVTPTKEKESKTKSSAVDNAYALTTEALVGEKARWHADLFVAKGTSTPSKEKGIFGPAPAASQVWHQPKLLLEDNATIGTIGRVCNDTCYDAKLYEQIHSILTAQSIPSLMRARIQTMVQQHEARAWWTGQAFEALSENSFYIEHLTALANVMYNHILWMYVVPRCGLSKYEDADDVLLTVQGLEKLWERVALSLSRDGYAKLGVDGPKRAKAMKEMVVNMAAGARRVVLGLK